MTIRARAIPVIFTLCLLAMILLTSLQRSSLPVSAQSPRQGEQYFLKFDGVDGESTSPDHPGEIYVQSFSWGQTRPLDSSAKIDPKSFRISLLADKSVPMLLRKIGNRERTPKAVLTARNSAGQDYMKWTLTDILVTAFQVEGGWALQRPTVTVDLRFSKIDIEYRQRLTNGGLSAAIKGWWELMK